MTGTNDAATSREAARAEGPWSDLALHTIGWKAFQDLCTQVCEEVLKKPVEIFREAQDGGQDAVFLLRARDGQQRTGTVQCKYSSDSRAQLRIGDLTDEFELVKTLVATDEAHTYVLMTSMSIGAPVAVKLRRHLRSLGVRKPHVFGRQYLIRTIRSSARLRALVPQVYGLAARGESRSYEGSTQSIRRTTLMRMAMGTRETDQPPLWIATSDLPTSPGHPFYARLTTLLDGHHFDRFVEGLCDRFYAPVMGRPSLAPGRYFRLLLVGYFEGIDSERGMAWRATDSLAVRSFLRLAVDEAPPDHSTIARTRRLIDLETHRTVFTWVQQRLVEAGRLKGKTIAIDATTLEANAAMRSIVRRDTGESYQAFLAGLAKASGIETPTREGLARLDRKRKKKKTSNTDWTNPHDPDAKVTKMKDGRTHLAHKAEHAVDMETGAIVAVTLQGADVGDTTTIIETAIAAAEQVEDAQANVDDRQSLEEIVGDKGYHSNQTLIDLDAVGIRSYVSEPDRGRRDWSKDPEARAPVYGNRRRMRGRRGRRLMRQRGERIERSFAHLYDTGGMRRTHLRGHTNILKRLLIHAGGFNLGLVMRHLIGIGTPRGLQGRVAAVLATLGVLMGVVRRRLTTISSSHRLIPAVRGRLASLATFAVNSSAAITCTTGC